jgi:hypothetical protein
VLKIRTFFQHINADERGINSRCLFELRKVILEKLKSYFNFFKTICKKLPNFIGYPMGDDAAEGRYYSLNISRYSWCDDNASWLMPYGGLMPYYQFGVNNPGFCLKSILKMFLQ